MKQSSIEWLESKVNQMIQNGGDGDLLAVLSHIKQCKQIHKEEIMDSYFDGGQEMPLTFSACNEYYNKNFNTSKE